MNLRRMIAATVGMMTLGLLVLVLASYTNLAANVTSLGAPGSSGRPMADTITNARTDGLQMNREVSDMSGAGVGSTGSIVSSGDIPVNITFVAGVSWASTSYAGPYTLFTYCPQAYYVFINRTATAGTNTHPIGYGFAAGVFGQIPIGNADGVTAHIEAVSTPGTVDYAVGTR